METSDFSFFILNPNPVNTNIRQLQAWINETTKEYKDEPNDYCGICGSTTAKLFAGICKKCEPEWKRQQKGVELETNNNQHD